MSIEILTRDHEVIFCLMDEISNYSLKDNLNHKEMKLRCAEILLDYCNEHFTIEEQAMRDLDYPLRQIHEKEHENLHTELKAVMFGVNCSDILALLDFMRNVIIKHIITWDEEFIKYAKSN